MAAQVPPAEVGCIVNGHAGVYGFGMIFDYAVEHGWEPTDEQKTDRTNAYGWGSGLSDNKISEAFERLVEDCDRAEAWLNENVAAPGCRYEWFDGEWFYSLVDDEDEEVEDAGEGEIVEPFRDTCSACGQEITW